jgi:hypothetical protein
MRSVSPSPAQVLARRIRSGRRGPALTAEITACHCSPAVRAGLYLLNGDWEAAHKTAQDIDTPLGSHWHALVHRHEPDFGNSKYWLARVGRSPIYPALAQAAQAAGQGAVVAPGGVWDPVRFTDCYAAPEAPAWTRELDALEMRLLLELSLAAAEP